MSSDRPRFLLSTLTFTDGPDRCRLHSRGFALFIRMGALLLVLSLFPSLRSESLVEASIHVALVLALAWLLWCRPKRVFATTSGLTVGAGKSFRHIPWSRVLDVRELPWLRVSPPWYPKLWQVDLEQGERFDFCGVRNAREVVVEFMKRSETGARRD